MTLFRSQKEIIHHITCTKCKYYFTFPTMSVRYDIERGQLYCPNCGEKGSVKIDDTCTDEQAIK